MQNLVRFFGYPLIFSGLFGFIFIASPIIKTEVDYRIDQIRGIKRLVLNQNKTSGFESVEASENIIIPLSTEYGIVIEKINANSKVIPGVNPANEVEYTRALKLGVAEALASTPPGQPGNLYLFAHSTGAPWDTFRYNAIFYLLRELEAGDRVIIFYQNQRFDYIVFDKTTTEPADVSYLTARYDSPILTLQTCDPPGTLFKRLIVRAKLVSS